MQNKYIVIDAHCDTIGEMYRKYRLEKSRGHLDIERMSKYKSWLQVFAVWYDGAKGEEKQKANHEKIIEHFYEEMASNSGRILSVKSGKDIQKVWNEGKIGAILSIEGGDWIKSESDIEWLYEKGVRCITLTWNYTNHVASGVGDEGASFGLTEFGKKAVAKMNELGMLVDVSHINEKAFWDVIEQSKMPVSATHSNAKTICPHRRNLTDEQFSALIKNGGVAGINYYPSFVRDCKKVYIDDIIKHIEHFCALGGEDHIGLGGDFDGIDAVPEDLCGVEDVYRLLDRLLALNYSQVAVDKIAYKNFERLFKQVIK